MVIHGGAWIWTGPQQVQLMAPRALRFSDAGYLTDNIDYRPGYHSLPDSLVEYDRLRRRLGRHAPICLWGGSSGGHLALMIATRRPDVACVMSEAGPTDLATDTNLLPGSHFLFDRHGGLARWSPVTYADQIRAPLLLVGATNDDVVPLSQARELARVHPQHTRVFVLHAGTSPWVHGSVDTGDLALLYRTERAFVVRSERSYAARRAGASARAMIRARFSSLKNGPPGIRPSRAR
jgi:acetyl esterase/lipase